MDIQAKERQNLNVHAEVQDLIAAQVEIADKYGGPVVATPAVIYKRMKKSGKTGRRTQVGEMIIAMPLYAYLSDMEIAHGVRFDRFKEDIEMLVASEFEDKEVETDEVNEEE